MSHTRVISEADIIPNRAAGYRLEDGTLKNQEWVAPRLDTTADGSLYFTIEDIAKWDEALEKRKILSQASFEQMWRPVRLNDGSAAPYGFGWHIGKTDSGHRLVEHGGAIPHKATACQPHHRYKSCQDGKFYLCAMRDAVCGDLGGAVALSNLRR